MSATNKTCKRLMILGTASASGKSLITTALCRIFSNRGFSTAPFKAQNMSNNSFVTKSGHEMGRAQVVQAFACRLEPDVRMNPLLLKPSSDRGTQVVLEGKPVCTVQSESYPSFRQTFQGTIQQNFDSLSHENDLILLEGAGSPAEINLKDQDLVNMNMAKMANAPVIIVGDIDRGGVFAALVGTMQLFTPEERERVKGFIINKFRGDVTLLEPGLRELEKLTGVPVLGVVPWFDHCIDEEDGVTERFISKSIQPNEIDICVIKLPHIANYTDCIPLESIPGASLRWCDSPDTFHNPDLCIIPGTKATLKDLTVLKECGLAKTLVDYANQDGMILGICGGFQMLGTLIHDPLQVESHNKSEQGLALLDMETTFSPEKQTEQVTFFIDENIAEHLSLNETTEAQGYEIHMGQSSFSSNALPFTYGLHPNGSKEINGVVNAKKTVMGTYIHGFFDTPEITYSIINMLRRKKGLAPLEENPIERKTQQEQDINRCAEIVEQSIDMEKVCSIIGL